MKSVKGGCIHGLALMNDGTVRSWGNNYYGQLGYGTSYSIRYAPAAVKNLTDIRNMDGGQYFTLAVTR